MRRWKRILGAVLACLLSAGTAAAESLLCVNTDDCAALLNVDGREIIAPGTWSEIFPLGDGLFALGAETEAGMLYALGGDDGLRLTEPEFEMLSVSGDVILFRQNRLYGAMDRNGQILAEPVYTQLVAAGEGFLAMTDDPFDEDADEIFRILPGGEMLDTGVSSDEGLAALRNDRMPVQNPRNERFGYINSMGQIVIEPQFETAGHFQNGIAIASENGLMGVIDPDGEWLIAPEYNYLEIGEGVIVGLIENASAVFFDMECKEIFRREGLNLEAAVIGGYPVVVENNVRYVYTKAGEKLFETDVRSKLFAGLNGQLVISDGAWGTSSTSIVSSQGVRSERTDQHLIPLSDGKYAFIRMNTAAYYSEELDEVRYSCDYDSLRYGMIDSDGNEILPAEYTEIRALGENRFLTVTEDGLSVVDGAGNPVWSKIKGE